MEQVRVRAHTEGRYWMTERVLDPPQAEVLMDHLAVLAPEATVQVTNLGPQAPEALTTRTFQAGVEVLPLEAPSEPAESTEAAQESIEVPDSPEGLQPA